MKSVFFFFAQLPHANERTPSQIIKDYFQVRHFLLFICWSYQSTLCEKIYKNDGGGDEDDDDDGDDDDENDNKKVLMIINMVVILMLTVIIIIIII